MKRNGVNSEGWPQLTLVLVRGTMVEGNIWAKESGKSKMFLEWAGRLWKAVKWVL